jgi:hypothetical protein
VDPEHLTAIGSENALLGVHERVIATEVAHPHDVDRRRGAGEHSGEVLGVHGGDGLTAVGELPERIHERARIREESTEAGAIVRFPGDGVLVEDGFDLVELRRHRRFAPWSQGPSISGPRWSAAHARAVSRACGPGDIGRMAHSTFREPDSTLARRPVGS